MVKPAAVDAELVRRLLAHFVAISRSPTLVEVTEFLAAQRIAINQIDAEALMAQLKRSMFGYGEIEPLISDAVTDVLVNGPNSVWIDGAAGLHRVELEFDDELAVKRLATRLAHVAGRRLDEAQPFVDALLPDGVRLQASIPPISTHGSQISLRFPASSPFPISTWTADLSVDQLLQFSRCVAGEQSFVISGLTGAGKTSLLRSMLAAMPANRRLVLLEDVAELNLQLSNLVALQGRIANAEGVGQVELGKLVRHAMRMRPDSLVIGEVRGPEVLDWLLAISSGHSGSATTVHANSAQHAVSRLVLLARLAGISENAAQSIMRDSNLIIIHCHRASSGRAINEISPAPNFLLTSYE